VRIFCEPSAQAIDQRCIAVCTAGLPAGIRRLAREVPDVRLGLSLGDVRPSRRRSLMPIDDAHPLSDVLDAVAEHAAETRCSPMWAYTLLAGTNDDESAASALADTILAFDARTGIRPRLSLIPYNPVAGADFERSCDDALARFRKILSARGVGSIVRYSGGGDVDAACGQLARSATGDPAGRSIASRPAATAVSSHEA
jgi:23S rRNA (adenine2503-C2)-methyltransferase